MKIQEFRRKKEGKTNYKKRLNLLISKKPRLVIRKSLKNIIVQIIEYAPDGDKVIVGANSKELEKKFEWKTGRSNIPAAYLTGYLLGKKANKESIKEAILDLGLNEGAKGGKFYAALKGVLDAGIEIPHSENILPSEERLNGSHISEEISKSFEEIKKKIE
jgi:large subunit ribosomal protein L18